jgi:glycosyltransferase involved in cell wall biosynthesis
MNVLQILGDPTGGIRKHVHQIISNSKAKGVVSFYIHGKTLDAVGKLDVASFEHNGVKRQEIVIKKMPHLSDLTNILFISSYCKKNNIDIVHGHGAKGGIYCRLVGLLVGIPSIYTPHGGSVHASFGIIEGFLYRTVERILKPITRLYLFESHYTYRSFIRSAGKLRNDRFLVNHNGVEKKSFSSTTHWLNGKGDAVNILVVGVLREIKGQVIAIDLLAKLQEQGGRSYHLHFCGDGPDLDKLKTKVSTYKLESCVTFHGEVDDISLWYEMSNIIVIPSLFESFGYVAVEAALMRRPVIASDCGGLAEIVVDGETGHLFTVGNIDSLLDKINHVFQDVVDTDKLVLAGAKRAEEFFDSTIMLENIYSAYKSLQIEISGIS